MSRLFPAIATALALAACGTPLPVAQQEAFSLEDRQTRNLVFLCGAGIREVNSARLVGALERTGGRVGLEFESEFKAAVPFSGAGAVDMYREFVGCLRDRATYSLGDGRQYSSTDLAARVRLVDPGFSYSMVSRWFGDDDLDMKYDFLFENQSSLTLTCRVRLQISVVNSYNTDDPIRNVWSERMHVSIPAGGTARIPGKLIAPEPRRRSMERVRAFATPLACWRV